MRDDRVVAEGTGGRGAAQCAVCLGEACRPLRPYRGHSDLFAGLHLVCCDSCGLVFADPMPADSRLAAYNAAYADNAHGGLNLHPLALLFHVGMARVRVEHVLSYCRQRRKSPESVLEIGPGHGFFAEHLRRLDPDCRYAAVESDTHTQTRLREMGIEVYAEPGELAGTEGRFDLLVMSHVLEHSADPRQTLENALRWVKPGGVLFVEVPCRDHEFKEEDEPHLLFFDKPSLDRLFTGLGLLDGQLSYHGKELEAIGRSSLMGRAYDRLYNIALRVGIHCCRKTAIGDDWIIRSIVRSHRADLEQGRPSWWLRAMATKPELTL